MKISRRKNIKIIYIEKPKYADHGFNMGVEVYEIKDNHAIRIGSNYRINTASWKGSRGVACDLVADYYTDFKHDGYLPADGRVIMFQQV